MRYSASTSLNKQDLRENKEAIDSLIKALLVAKNEENKSGVDTIRGILEKYEFEKPEIIISLVFNFQRNM